MRAERVDHWSSAHIEALPVIGHGKHSRHTQTPHNYNNLQRLLLARELHYLMRRDGEDTPKEMERCCVSIGDHQCCVSSLKTLETP
jgi:hypothetical protein